MITSQERYCTWRIYHNYIWWFRNLQTIWSWL